MVFVDRFEPDRGWPAVIYIVAKPPGTYLAPICGRRLLKMKVTSIMEISLALPYWAELSIHVPFLAAFLLARAVVLVESLQALPANGASSREVVGVSASLVREYVCREYVCREYVCRPSSG
jgi:hypothetical protein